MFSSKPAIIVAFCLALFATTATAQLHQPSVDTAGMNLWSITFYLDESPVHAQWATQELCFFYLYTSGTQDVFQWVSTTFPDWNGTARQEGDQVFMIGDFEEDKGHTASELDLTTVSLEDQSYGHYQRWMHDGEFGHEPTFHNIKMTRVGKCPVKDPKEALEKYRNIRYPINPKTGKPMYTPSGYIRD